MKSALIIALLILTVTGIAYGQAGYQPHYEDLKPNVDLKNVALEQYRINVSKTPTPIKLDGNLTEEAWLTTDSIVQFYKNYPYDTGYASLRTVVRILQDDQHLYISAVCYNKKAGKYIATSLARDWSTRNTDGFQWVIDPFQDKTNGYGFAVSPYNAQRDGLLSNGGNDDINTSWDNKWYSETKIYPDRWVLEASIPFKSIRYKSRLPYWRMNFARIDYNTNEMSVWVPMYRNFSIANLGYTGKAFFEEPVEKKGQNISIIPYLSGQASVGSNFNSPVYRGGAGLDGKIGIGSASNLDLTVNPDFSQVEVDRQVTNLSRFEIFFPERRNFFLENQDLFDTYGSSRVRPFFSRRIGITYDTTINQYVSSPILFGARLSGKLNQNWRLGMLSTLTGNTGGNQGDHTFMGSVQKRVFERSIISGFFLNRQAVGTANEVNLTADPHNFNRNAGLEYTLLSADNRWTGKAYYHLSSKADIGSKLGNLNSSMMGGNLVYNDRKFFLGGLVEHIGQTFTAQMGYLPRTNYTLFAMDAGYSFLNSGGSIASHGPSFSAETYFMPVGRSSFQQTDHNIRLGYSLGDNRTRYFSVNLVKDFIYLFRPFRVLNRAGSPILDSGTSYNNYRASWSYRSDIRKRFTGTYTGNYGQFYNGHLLTMDANIAYRIMPYASFGLTGTMNQIYLPAEFGSPTLWLLGPNLSLTVTNTLFFKMYCQLNSQTDNLNINARLQWRFQPASDLFIVYSSNYFMLNDRSQKNAALVLKLNYWLNV